MIDAHGTSRSNFLLHYNFRPTASARPAGWGQSAAKSATAVGVAHSARSGAVPPATNSITSGWCRDHQIERVRRRWPRFCGLGAGADGWRRADPAPVAGVAMGLTGRRGDPRSPTSSATGTILRQGFQRAVAGTAAASLQMDIKIAGITPSIMEQALARTKDGRMHSARCRRR